MSTDDDRADLARIDEILAEKKRGDSLPLEGMKRILAGESPVRVWREYRGLSQAKLAAEAGIVASHVSMIENGNRAGTVAKLKRIATALGVDVGELRA